MKPITSGQKEQCVTVIKDAARKGGEEAINELAASGVVNCDNFQRVLGLGDKIAPRVRTFVKELLVELMQNTTGYFKLISGAETLELDPTDGTKTIAQSGNVFTGGFAYDFGKWGLNVKGKPTSKLKVQVHEVIKDGTFAQIFGDLNDDLRALCIPQSQIMQFVKNHRKWLHPNCSTSFLFEVNGEFFFADVGAGSGGLSVHVRRFSRDSVWDAGSYLRIVFPQLAPATI